MNDDSLLPFGEHKGKRLIDVPAVFLLFLYDNETCYGELKEYIDDNLIVLRKEVEDNKRNFTNYG